MIVVEAIEMKVLAIVALVLFAACSRGPNVDHTFYVPTISPIEEQVSTPRGATYTTDEDPVLIPNFSLKKVSVKRDNEKNVRFTAFLEPEQNQKITRKGQRVRLYQVDYFHNSTGNANSFVVARLE